jgi:methyltransferase (TIGR00027 family)
MGVAALRAAHLVIDGPPPILDDRLAIRLLDEPSRAWLEHGVSDLQRPGLRGLRSHVVVRSRYAEDALESAVERGVRQFISLGAGFDTFAFRQPSWADALRIWEVDAPATQGEKRERLALGGIPDPDNLTWVPIDFEREQLVDRLSLADVNLAEPVFFSWLGVSVYLDAEANDAMFRFVGGLSDAEIVFTFSPKTDELASPSRLPELVAAIGEPWKTAFRPEELHTRLLECGLRDVIIPPVTDIVARYFSGRSDGLSGPRRTTIAHARTRSGLGATL